MTERDQEAITVREFEATLAEVRRAVDKAADAASAADTGENVSIGAHLGKVIDVLASQLADRIEALDKRVQTTFDEHRTGTAVAEQEREKAALALRDEQSRAMEQAEREREKAAHAMRVGLDRAISEGDDRLREHIEQQYRQINAALESARRETALIQVAAKEGIEKSDTSINKRLDLLNEFRSQIAADANRYAQRETVDNQIAQLQNKLDNALPREVYEQSLTSWSQWRESIDKRINEQRGTELQLDKTDAKLQPWAIWAAGAMVTIFITIIVIATNLLTTGG